MSFEPSEALVEGVAAGDCRACVILPARNEESTLPACLDALAAQLDLCGRPMPFQGFEILLLLNNCSDDSGGVARQWQAEHPSVALHVAERSLPAELAHAGTARRLLMDTAWQRLRDSEAGMCAILSTDADSTVAPDWIAQNLRALERGADAVGGLIVLREEDLAALPASVRRCYERDRRYAALAARLEDLLDPQPGDAWPRHLEHFGSSLACTPAAYAHAGGMPAVSPLEDEAFVDRLRRADQRLRHEPEVKVFTSARLEGRAEVGLAGQLRLWSELPSEAAHTVQSAEFLAHRFRALRRLREVWRTRDVRWMSDLPAVWRKSVEAVVEEASSSFPSFLTAVDCDGLIAATFVGEREQRIPEAIAALEDAICLLCP